MTLRLLKTTLLVAVMLWSIAAPAEGKPCHIGSCSAPTPDVDADNGTLTATYFEERAGLGYASQSTVEAPVHIWRLQGQCDVTDAATGGCGVQQQCDQVANRVISYYVVQFRRLASGDGSPVDGQAAPPGVTPGTPFGSWTTAYAGCVDVTDLNPAPTPDEVYRYFRTLPLPHLDTIEQPPGTALVGLPVVFHTDGPTTQTYRLTIRGFAVSITATATTYTWHTGDGTDLTTTSPGAPWPDTIAIHNYRSGTYASSLTTTWTATFTIDNGPPTPVPGSTTTTGPTTTFTVVQAHPVLTNPYD